MTPKAKEELLNLVDQIATLEQKVREVGSHLAEIRGEIELIRARLLLEVAWERDRRGQPIYSKQKQREAAVAARLAEHDEYQALREHEKALRHERDDLLNELRQLSERKELLTAE